MRALTRPAWLRAGIFAFALGVAFVGTAMAEPTVVASNSATYQDSTGENPAAPDIGTVVVSNDDTGLISFAVTFTNRSVLGSTEYVWVDVDTDSNPVTGWPPYGLDYSVQYHSGRVSLWRWDTGSQDWVIAPMSTLRTDWAAGKLTVHVNASELGGTSAFRFGVESDSNPTDPNAAYDLAPDRLPLWTYEVKLAPVVSVGALAVTPQPAVTGKAMVAKATVTVTRGGKAEALPSTATIDWVATIGTQRLEPTSATVAANGVLVASWQVPKTAKAKSIRVALAVTMEGVTGTQTQDVTLLYVAPVLRVTTLDCKPEPATAGKAMVGKATVMMTRGGVPEALPPTAKARWTATIGNVRLMPTTTKLSPSGVLTSNWVLPKVIKGKSVRITLIVTADGASVTKTHIHRIK